MASWLGARTIPHEILRWVGPKPASGIQEAAREARYGLLTTWCRGRSCLHLLAAHHLEDQIETYLIRRRAGSGVDGLAGMAAVRELPGCRLVRPLLSVSRRRLGALLAAAGQAFLRDPSNLNPVFERARLRLGLSEAGFREKTPPRPVGERAVVRGRTAEYLPPPLPGLPVHGEATPGSSRGQALARNAGEGLKDRDLEALAELRACARERIGREQAMDALSARALALHPAGFAVLDRAVLAAADPEIAASLLSRVVGCLGGSRYLARAARLAGLRVALAQEPPRARTLGGCRFVPWRDRVLVLREVAAAQAPILLEPGDDLLWDRRFAVALSPEAAGAVTIGYLGQHAGAAQEGHFGRILPPLIHSALPAFWDGRGVTMVPHLGYSRPGPPVLTKLSFRPVKPLAPPSFTVV